MPERDGAGGRDGKPGRRNKGAAMAIGSTAAPSHGEFARAPSGHPASIRWPGEPAADEISDASEREGNPGILAHHREIEAALPPQIVRSQEG